MDMISISLIFTIIAAGLVLLSFLGKLKLRICFSQNSYGATKAQHNEPYGGINYSAYEMKSLEYAATLIIAAVTLFIVGYIFYRNVYLSFLLAFLCFAYPKIRVRQIIVKRKEELKHQFRDALHSLSSSLQAGKSFETAMRSAIEDLLIQYERDAYIIQEFEIIVRKLESNETIEKSFRAFAERSSIEEIQSFAEILEVCKRSGGNLIAAIKGSTEVISDKIEVNNEIYNILAQKKLEKNVLTIMPIIMIFMLSTSAKDFMQPVFTEVIGRIGMTVSIVLFGFAYIIAGKITNIEV